MLSPATPLTIAFLAAFVLLLLATLSTPVIKSIPLGNFQGYNLGVFGYCEDSGPNPKCSSVQVGYNDTRLWPQGDAPDSFSSGTRTTLTYILIIHPVAAFLVFICTILAAAAHFPSPGHSSRYLLGLLILTFPTLLVTLLAFLVDILLFIPPHMGWGGWIVLPATLIITACSVVTCAMRRTLVSRKARKERIEKNEDMNGSTYYAMKQETQFRAPEATQYRAPEETQFARAESPPPLVTNGEFAQEKSAQFAPYDYERNQSANASIHTDGSGQPQQGSMTSSNILGGAAAVGAAAGVAGAMATRDHSASPMNYDERPSPGGSFDRSRPPRGGGPGYGRGGPPPNFYPRGRGGPRGPRGGYYPPPRGAYGRGGGGPRGPPPPGWNGYGRGGPGPMHGRGRSGPPPGYPTGYYGGSPPPQQGPDGAMMYAGLGGSIHGRSSSDRARGPWPAPEDNYQSTAANGDWDLRDTQDETSRAGPSPSYLERSGSQGAGAAAPAYERRPSTGDSRTRDPASFGFSGRVPSPARSQRSGHRSPSPPPPVPPMSFSGAPPGQAVEMDANTGSPKPYESAQYDGQSGGTYPNQSQWQPPPAAAELGSRSPPSRYDTPVGLSTAGGGVTGAAPTKPQSPHQPRASNDGYYEDVDPRFSEDTERGIPYAGSPTHQQQHSPASHHDPMPSALMPGGYAPTNNTYSSHHLHQQHPIYPSGATDPHDDSRSPNASEDEGSNFTSISQRGINPDWQPPSQAWSGTAAAQRERERGRDQILTTNPDFALPGAGPGRVNRGAGHVRGMSSGNSHHYPDPV